MAPAQQLQVLRRMVATMLHHLNNRLAEASNQLEMLAMDLTDDGASPGARAEVEGAKLSVMRGVDLSRQLMAYVRADAGRTCAFDLFELLERTNTLLSFVLGKNVRITMNLSPTLDITSGPDALYQQAYLVLAYEIGEWMGMNGAFAVTGEMGGRDWAAPVVSPRETAESYIVLRLEGKPTHPEPTTALPIDPDLAASLAETGAVVESLEGGAGFVLYIPVRV